MTPRPPLHSITDDAGAQRTQTHLQASGNWCGLVISYPRNGGINSLRPKDDMFMTLARRTQPFSVSGARIDKATESRGRVQTTHEEQTIIELKKDVRVLTRKSKRPLHLLSTSICFELYPTSIAGHGSGNLFCLAVSTLEASFSHLHALLVWPHGTGSCCHQARFRYVRISTTGLSSLERVRCPNQSSLLKYLASFFRQGSASAEPCSTGEDTFLCTYPRVATAGGWSAQQWTPLCEHNTNLFLTLCAPRVPTSWMWRGRVRTYLTNQRSTAPMDLSACQDTSHQSSIMASTTPCCAQRGGCRRRIRVQLPSVASCCHLSHSLSHPPSRQRPSSACVQRALLLDLVHLELADNHVPVNIRCAPAFGHVPNSLKHAVRPEINSESIPAGENSNSNHVNK